jgi:hypothetical protein
MTTTSSSFDELTLNEIQFVVPLALTGKTVTEETKKGPQRRDAMRGLRTVLGMHGASKTNAIRAIRERFLNMGLAEGQVLRDYRVHLEEYKNLKKLRRRHKKAENLARKGDPASQLAARRAIQDSIPPASTLIVPGALVSMYPSVLHRSAGHGAHPDRRDALDAKIRGLVLHRGSNITLRVKTIRERIFNGLSDQEHRDRLNGLHDEGKIIALESANRVPPEGDVIFDLTCEIADATKGEEIAPLVHVGVNASDLRSAFPYGRDHALVEGAVAQREARECADAFRALCVEGECGLAASLNFELGVSAIIAEYIS